MEYLLVRFGESREVIIDSAPHGHTNIVLQLEAGRHTVTLGPPRNFAPLEQTVLVVNTAPLDPYRVTFERLPASAVPLSPGLRRERG
jgi:hypothetical protein